MINKQKEQIKSINSKLSSIFTEHCNNYKSIQPRLFFRPEKRQLDSAAKAISASPTLLKETWEWSKASPDHGGNHPSKWKIHCPLKLTWLAGKAPFFMQELYLQMAVFSLSYQFSGVQRRQQRMQFVCLSFFLMFFVCQRIEVFILVGTQNISRNTKNI